jgi:uncharacterized glyoxalase superfamily protein PhnB
MASKKKQAPQASKAKRAPPKRTAKNTRPIARRRARRKPESLRLRESSLSLTVSDLKQSVAWYRDVLGFTEGERWEEGGAVLGQQVKAGAVDLMLNQDDFAKGRDRHKGEGVRIWWSTSQPFDALADAIRAKGAKLDYGPDKTPWGDRAFGVTDPDGFHITVVAAP